MFIHDAIRQKQRGCQLDSDQIHDMFNAYHQRRITDEAMAIFLNAVKQHRLNADETTALTQAIAASGKRINWQGSAVANRIKIDQPSTGGLGNKSPLIAPVIAAAGGAVVPKMSTRGTIAGTIDILEAVGYQAEVPIDRYIQIVSEIGIANICQTPDLAPLDARLMQLRRRTDTMRQGELVVSSILAKKLATGCQCLVVDVKTGSDSKFGDIEATKRGAQLMVAVGKRLCIKVVCVLTDNDAPQGRYIGSGLSLVEVLEVFSGQGPADQRRICLELAARMLLLSELVADYDRGYKLAIDLLDSGRAMAKFREQLLAHQADLRRINAPQLLQDAHYKIPVPANATGYITAIATAPISACAKHVIYDQSGRRQHNAGIVLTKGVGDYIESGQPLAMIHADQAQSWQQLIAICQSGYRLSAHPPLAKSPIIGRVEADGRYIPGDEFADNYWLV